MFLSSSFFFLFLPSVSLSILVTSLSCLVICVSFLPLFSFHFSYHRISFHLFTYILFFFSTSVISYQSFFLRHYFLSRFILFYFIFLSICLYVCLSISRIMFPSILFKAYRMFNFSSFFSSLFFFRLLLLVFLFLKHHAKHKQK